MSTLVKRYPLVAFFSLTTLFLLLGWAAFNGQIPFGPLLAALILVPLIGGRAGLKTWAKRIIQWRVGWQWYAAAILLPLIATGTGSLLNILLGASVTPIQVSELPSLIPEAAFVLLFVGLGEEPGFRGFAIPHLQARFSAITATLILAAYGVAWHLPLFLTNDTPWAAIPTIVLGYFVFTWLFNNSNGSVLIVMVFHTAQAIFGPGILATMFSSADLMRYTLLMGLVYGVIVAVLIATSRNRYLISTSIKPLLIMAEPSQAIVSQ